MGIMYGGHDYRQNIKRFGESTAFDEVALNFLLKKKEDFSSIDFKGSANRLGRVGAVQLSLEFTR